MLFYSPGFKNVFWLFFFILLFFFPFDLSAQDFTVLQNGEKIKTRDYWKKSAFDDVKREHPIVLVDRNAEVQSKRIEKIYSSEEFNYQEERVDRLSFLAKLERRINQFFKSIFPTWTYQSNKGVENLLIFLGVIALVYIIYRLVFSGNAILRIDKKEVLANGSQFIEKNLERIDLDTYLKQAIDGKKFDLAVRYLYLANLQALAKEDYIKWDHRKTNSDFLNEIQDGDLKQKFQETTSIFNYVWFGELEVNIHLFEEYKADFLDFKNHISK